MARPLRIEYPDAWYHVMNRGAGKKKIFHTNNHYQLFLGLLDEITHRHQIQIHAYCLMPNHYHLLINTPLGNLNKVMKHLNGVYTQSYNRLQKTDGPLFRGRYKSIIIDETEYLLVLNRYIHLNPVLARIVKKPEQYQWSSYRSYLNPKTAPSWITTKYTLDNFESNMQQKTYQIFIEEGVQDHNEIPDPILKKMKRLPILGSNSFIKTVIKNILLTLMMLLMIHYKNNYYLFRISI